MAVLAVAVPEAGGKRKLIFTIVPMKRNKQQILLLSFFLVLAVACSNPIGEHHEEWKKYFDEYEVDGCITIYDLKAAKFIDYNSDRCAQRFTPASTFKICNSLIALETKVIADANEIIKWDSVERPIASWNHDQDMEEAFGNSTVWYYQEVTRRIGTDKMQQYLNMLSYGNKKMGSTIDSFWLNGDLRISCDEQIEFLKNFRTLQLPLSKRAMLIVKNIMVLDSTSQYKLSGKTGWGVMQDESTEGKVLNIGWFVGYLERGDNAWFFATNIEAQGNAPEDFFAARKEITLNVLKELKLLDQ